MRKRIVAIILFGFLFGQANLLELTKFPALVAHFISHQNENPDLGFFDFIHAHYCHEHFHCAQHESDHSLPFQSCDFHFANFVLQAPERIEVAAVHMEESHEHRGYYATPSLENMAMDIWQPPKI